jgi:hypothetical protein
MRLLLAAFLLTTAPALAQSLPGQQSSKLVLLAGEEGAKQLAIPPPPPATAQSFVPEDPFAPIYKRLVSMQLQLMELQRVSLAGPIAVTLFGGTGLAVGITMLAVGFASYGFFIVGLIVLGVSALPLLIGIPWLVGATSTNARITRAIEKLKREQQTGQVSSRTSAPLSSAVLATF